MSSGPFKHLRRLSLLLFPIVGETPMCTRKNSALASRRACSPPRRGSIANSSTRAAER
jgi:hypothetical protein